jgi:hypothetical protein
LSCPAARYNPVTDAMTFFSSVELMWWFVPAYIVELVPQPDPRRIGTDYPYATVKVSGQFFSVDYVADLALARMPVDTVEQANTVVQKVIRYKQDPPADDRRGGWGGGPNLRGIRGHNGIPTRISRRTAASPSPTVIVTRRRGSTSMAARSG